MEQTSGALAGMAFGFWLSFKAVGRLNRWSIRTHREINATFLTVASLIFLGCIAGVSALPGLRLLLLCVAAKLLKLGRVDKPNPLFDRSQLGEAEKAARGMIVSGGDTPAVLETIEEALDPVAGGVERDVNRMLNAPVLFGADLRPTTTRTDVITDGIAVVAAVG